MPTLKYIYFNVRGRGETSRLLLAAAGLPYEDKRIEFAEWPALKPNTPAGTLPILEVDGKPLIQSLAIARYIAREGGLMGKNSLEQAHIDVVVDSVTDVREAFVRINFLPEAENAPALKNLVEKTLAAALPFLEKIAAANKEKPGVFVGAKISIADIHFFSIAELLQIRIPDVLGPYPHLKKVYDGVAACPKIAEYLKKRPTTPF